MSLRLPFALVRLTLGAALGLAGLGGCQYHPLPSSLRSL